MGKRLTREESRQLTRQRLLQAAAELFGRQGFGATSIEEVAEAAGYSRGAFYANFADKDELFLALFDLCWEQMTPRWTNFFLEEVALQERQRKGEVLVKQEMTRLATEEQGTWTMLLLECILYALREPQARNKLRDHFHQNYEHLARLLEAADPENREGRLSSIDRAWLLYTLFIGITTQLSLDPESTPDNAWLVPLAVLFGSDGFQLDR
jgi:AcrR family transcriptional regulator